ncbi:helix-turn-helix domain-containing protein [Dankookia sp. P2]|uniref:helix-turn-helix domain-containing protein n=1 Tax=Dankookia sp. P2 TaxID=3423955 RepID=UPI003D66B5D6
MLTVAQVAGHCQVAVRTVRRWIAADELPVLQLGRAIRIVESDLEHFLRKAQR